MALTIVIIFILMTFISIPMMMLALLLNAISKVGAKVSG
jgi:hypothetical protein